MDEELQNTCQTFRSFATAPPEKWRLSRLENGLRIFEEEEDPQRSTDERSPGCKVKDESRATENRIEALTSFSFPLPFFPTLLQGVGLICSRPEPIFRRVMDLEESRREWDLTFDHGSVIEVIDEHTDVIQVTFRRPVRMRDVLSTRSIPTSSHSLTPSLCLPVFAARFLSEEALEVRAGWLLRRRAVVRRAPRGMSAHSAVPSDVRRASHKPPERSTCAPAAADHCPPQTHRTLPLHTTVGQLPTRGEVEVIILTASVVLPPFPASTILQTVSARWRGAEER